MSKKSSRTKHVRARSQDKRNESPRYKPLLIAIAVIVVGFGAYKMLAPTVFGIDIRIEPALTGVLVSHEGVLTMPAEDIMIPYYTITGVDLLPSRPQLKKIEGLDGLKTLIGRFQAEGIGEVQVYAFDYRDPETRFVKITTSEKTYIITPTDAEHFVGVVLSQMPR